MLARLSTARAWSRTEPHAPPGEAEPRPGGAEPQPLPGAWPVASPDPPPVRAEAALTSDGGVYVHIVAPEAVRSAASAARERALPLAGWRLAVKDCIAVAGQPIGAGSACRQEARAEPRDAVVVERLRAKGAAVAGTVTLHELASGITGVNAYPGTPENPAAPGCIPGGSSSGSAVAVAEGSADLALGTDTGGSARVPAAFCGVVGFKPAQGAYPMTGVLPLAPSFDCVGLLARRTTDVEAGHLALGGGRPEHRLPAVVGFAPSQLEAADPEIGRRAEALLDALARLGSRVVEVPWPHGEEVFVVGTTIFFAEAAAAHGRFAVERPECLGADIRERLLVGLAIPAVDYLGAVERARVLRRRAQDTLSTVDCLIGPTVPIFPPALADGSSAERTPELVANTRLANITGLPALSIPSPERPPSGIQVMAADDARTLGYGAAIESVLRAGG
jgi:Asp-tRNA(Asn)/Glu-tRNA(Gln) amidotransferase A subunit family amidase